MTHYHILPSPGAEPIGPAISEAKLLPAISDLAGRNVLGIPSVRRALRRNGSVYIACNRAGLYPGRGFIVKRYERDTNA